MTTLLVCDDVGADRDSVRRTVAMIQGVDRVITASSGEEALLRYESDRPDVVLMDVRMPGIGGVEAAHRLTSTHPDALIVMLTSAGDPEGVGRAVAGGARGYVAKDASQEEFASVISLVMGAGAPTAASAHTPEGPRPVLSDREQQVLERMAQGMSNAEIGHELFLSEDTVKTHARRLFRKMGAPDRAAAVATGFRWGLLR